MKVVKGLHYTKDHEWVKLEGNLGVIGVADYAQHHLGDIVYVELPEVDDEIEKEEAFSAVESVKAAADIYMPVSGKVVEVNEELIDDPALLNADPYENWMIKVEMTNKDELEELMTSEEYEKFLAEEE
ncbi:glycine cleavage system protein GcvH [Tissierella praeacuta]|uniref:Glycine cleavage system H protein n=1 Tax=Tissierella praeacuta DSM 18095 TaxID=1123404 RepID=A0A1M4YAX4_9FIRM|nr:glycine cleavage system protein GcvH [Tissierella praeacuta]HAE91065.1 glycine cleavage system protein GcvH [Tissierella sp.]MBU5256304.1 glycine cleavage system protein GcvH [Tissierella praeacuta]TCU69672.1 glycine cleavage system H protein [Tissierella praeacuta]SHF02924.1 glycine cleavage system H protein [Tissierella praeacuta DSM 18095]SUP03230.1 Octanoyl/lipoyl carrier protein [Tissierella praeacuta]